MKLLYWNIAFALALGGCANMMGGMTPEQIKAAVQDKSASLGCTKYTGTGGQFVAAFSNLDKGSLGTGGGNLSIKCGEVEFTISESPKAAQQPQPASASPSATGTTGK